MLFKNLLQEATQLSTFTLGKRSLIVFWAKRHVTVKNKNRKYSETFLDDTVNKIINWLEEHQSNYQNNSYEFMFYNSKEGQGLVAMFSDKIDNKKYMNKQLLIKTILPAKTWDKTTVNTGTIKINLK